MVAEEESLDLILYLDETTKGEFLFRVYGGRFIFHKQREKSLIILAYESTHGVGVRFNIAKSTQGSES